MHNVLLAVIFILCTASSIFANTMGTLTETFKSGATFTGELTFSDDLTDLLGVNGKLSISGHADDPITWVWWGGNGSVSQQHGQRYDDFLMDGTKGGSYSHFIELYWSVKDGSIVLHKPASGYMNAINYSDLETSYTFVVSESDPPSRPGAVPEPATMVLFGAGIVGLAGIRNRTVRRKK